MAGDILTFFFYAKGKELCSFQHPNQSRETTVSYKCIISTGHGDGEGGRGEGVGFCVVALAGELSSLKEHSRLLSLP